MLDKSMTAYSALRRRRLPDTASICENTEYAAAKSCFPIWYLDGVGSKLLAGKKPLYYLILHSLDLDGFFQKDGIVISDEHLLALY